MARNSLPPPTTWSRLCAIIRHYGEQSPRSTKAPKYLVDCCNPDRDTASRRRLRSAGRHYLTVPRYRLGSFGRRAFSAAGPTVWNSLPDSLRDPALSSSSNSFRQQGGLLKLLLCYVQLTQTNCWYHGPLRPALDCVPSVLLVRLPGMIWRLICATWTYL